MLMMKMASLPWQRDDVAGSDAACKVLIEAKADVTATDKDRLTGKERFYPKMLRSVLV